MTKEEKKKQKEEVKEETSQEQKPAETVTEKTSAKLDTMKVHVETPGPIYAINGYGPIYNIELEVSKVFDLLREGVIVTDSVTRKRIIIKDGKPAVE